MAGLLDDAIPAGQTACQIECDQCAQAVIQVSKEKAREFSKKRIDRMLRHLPVLAADQDEDPPRPGDVVGHLTRVELEALQAKLSGLDTLTELLYRYLAFVGLDESVSQREVEGLALAAKGLVSGAQYLVESVQCSAPGAGRGGDA